MDKALREFLADAKSVSLTPAERVVGKDKLLQHIEGVQVASLAAEAQAVQLSTKEKRAGKKELQTFMKAHPAAKVVAEGFFARFGRLFTIRLPAMAMVVVLLVTAGGGAAYGAESALPGDLLYPVKTEVTEPLRERFARTPERRAHFAAWRIERRLQEAEKLLERAESDPTLLDDLKTRIEMHTAHLEQRMEQLESDDQAEHIRVRLENRIEKHEEILDSIDEGTFDPASLVRFRKHIRGRKEHIRKMGPPLHKIREKLEERSPEVKAILEKYEQENGRLPPPRQLREQLSPEERETIKNEVKEVLPEIRKEKSFKQRPVFQQGQDNPAEFLRRPPPRVHTESESGDAILRKHVDIEPTPRPLDRPPLIDNRPNPPGGKKGPGFGRPRGPGPKRGGLQRNLVTSPDRVESGSAR